MSISVVQAHCAPSLKPVKGGNQKNLRIFPRYFGRRSCFIAVFRRSSDGPLSLISNDVIVHSRSGVKYFVFNKWKNSLLHPDLFRGEKTLNLSFFIYLFLYPICIDRLVGYIIFNCLWRVRCLYMALHEFFLKNTMKWYLFVAIFKRLSVNGRRGLYIW